MNGFSENRKITLAFIIGLVVGIGVTWLWFATEPEQQNGGEEVATTTDSGSIAETSGDESQDDTDTSDETNGSDDTQSEQDEPNTEVGDGDTVTVTRQVPGDSVQVSSVSFSSPGWVVIHELDANGELSNALGAKWFPAGDGQSDEVSLLRGTEGESQYAAVLYRDDGDRNFELEQDGMITNAAGEPVQARFETMSGAAGN